MHSLSLTVLRKETSRSAIALIVKLLFFLVPFLAIYWQDLDIVFREALVNDFLNYILIIPILIGYIIYRKRKMLKAVSPLTSDAQEKRIFTSQVVTGISLLTISFIIYFLGSYTSYALEYHLLSLPLFIAGGIALVFNLETLKTLLFPIALLFFIQPYLIQLVNPFWSDLSWISSTTAYNLVTAIRIPVKFTTVLEVPTIEVTTTNGETLPFTVGVASSGLNSLMGFTVFSIFVAYILREPLWKRFTLMLIGYPLLTLLNTLRITIILSLAYQWGTAVAEVFHLTGGMVLVFIGTILLLFIGEKVWKVKIYPIKPASSSCIYCEVNLMNGNNFCMSCGKVIKSISHVITKRLTLEIVFVILMTFLFLLIQTSPIVLAKSPTEMDLTTISPEESKQLLPNIPDWSLQFLYRDSQVEKILKQDAALAFAYTSTSTPNNSSYAYIFVSVQVSVGRHSWEASLVWYPAKFGRPTANVLDLRDVQILQNPTLTARFFAFQRPKSNLTEVVLYWFERVSFKVGSVWDTRNVEISLWARSDDLARSGLISRSDDLEGVEKVYLPLAQSIANYWQPIKTSSMITALVSQHGSKIVTTTGVLLTGAIVLHVLERRKERKANVKAYQKLSKPDKQLIDIVRQTEKTTTPTLNAIAAKYQSIVGENINKEILSRKLVEAEKIGIAKNSIANEQDEPIQIWKTQIPLDKTWFNINNKWLTRKTTQMLSKLRISK